MLHIDAWVEWTAQTKGREDRPWHAFMSLQPLFSYATDFDEWLAETRSLFTIDSLAAAQQALLSTIVWSQIAFGVEAGEFEAFIVTPEQVREALASYDPSRRELGTPELTLVQEAGVPQWRLIEGLIGHVERSDLRLRIVFWVDWF